MVRAMQVMTNSLRLVLHPTRGLNNSENHIPSQVVRTRENPVGTLTVAG